MSTEELRNILDGFKAGLISYEDVQKYLGNHPALDNAETTSRECFKPSRKSGIRSNRELPRHIQMPKRNNGRTVGSRTTAERNLTIILIMISLYDEWGDSKYGRADKLISRISSRVGRNIGKRSIERIVQEWNQFKKDAVYQQNDAISCLQWYQLVESFKEEYMLKYDIKDYNPLKIK